MNMQEEMDRQVEHILNFKGSIKGRSVINQDRMSGAKLLHKDNGVEAHDDYVKLTRDSCGQLSFSAKRKCTTTLRMLAHGTAADAVGGMVRMGKSTCLKTTVKFACAMVEVFGPEYLIEPNVQDTKKLLAIEEARGSLGMLGSIDCMHWQWKNCPKGLRGMYHGHTREATIISGGFT
ncbi:uncharacterized protein [Aegilops tauschii subsp. strangulata]|uniref:uncharacterized protein n=1 Tax=Aegilops tauschii subsp. strangulata TaxID=200361 RepID=UPI003CC8A542